MSSFTEPLDTRYMHDTKNWMILREFDFYIGGLHTDRHVIVPNGFRSDGASVPQPFWNIIPPWGEYGQAAVLHDWLCEYRTIIVRGQPQSISREEADFIFREAMEVLNVPKVQREAMHAAVRSYARLKGIK